ncbi:MAG TPA: PHB depolymerase family esterase, partial [Acidimicrobiales bacterium]|nr:PHB depolymerase family esterase [Acidimicrobiales bacterium]
FRSYWYPAAGAPGARRYWLYLPPGTRAGMPVVVYLHGCTQDAPMGALESGFNRLADAAHLIVVYPEQTVTPGSSAPLADGNGEACWNWFLPQDQVRGEGEPATIAGITERVVGEYGADRSRVFVEGVSAGADMAVILGATYPDRYAAIGAIAGCPYATCSDLSGRLAYQAMGSHHRVVPAYIEQGTADTLNAYPLGAALVQQWLGTDDLADDGAADGSVGRVPASTTDYGFDQSPSPGTGDACVQPSNFPCPGGVVGFQHTYPYTVQKYADGRGCDVVDFWTIHGLEHAYPDAPTNATFSDPLGPDITTAAYRFFMAHPMSGGCPSAS